MAGFGRGVAFEKHARLPLLKGRDWDAEGVLSAALAMPGNHAQLDAEGCRAAQPPELDAIAGPILRGAQKHWIEVPATKKLVAAVEQRAGLTTRLA